MQATHSQPIPELSKRIDTFPNPAADRDYIVHIDLPEFTCVCPITQQPDFAKLVIDYVPDALNIELKSLKLYMWGFRDQGVFHEAVTNRILNDLVSAIKPRFMRLISRWYVRGGIFTSVLVEHVNIGWKPAPVINIAQFPSESSIS